MIDDMFPAKLVNIAQASNIPTQNEWAEIRAYESNRINSASSPPLNDPNLACTDLCDGCSLFKF